jgi:hypothetical protein
MFSASGLYRRTDFWQSAASFSRWDLKLYVTKCSSKAAKRCQNRSSKANALTVGVRFGRLPYRIIVRGLYLLVAGVLQR